MHDFLFILFSVLTLVSACLVITNRNPVNGAMYMILSLVGMAGLFLNLEAYFLAVLQVLVYAGAVMVLFLFIIMLIDAKKEETRLRYTGFTALGGLLCFIIFSAAVYHLFTGSEALPEIVRLPAAETLQVTEQGGGKVALHYASSPEAFGYGLFTKYMLPLQMTGFLLLIAMIGVIVLSKRYGSDKGQTAPGNAAAPTSADTQ